jgi:hypothetical protein
MSGKRHPQPHHSACQQAAERRDLPKVLEQDLRAHYELPQDLPHRLLTLLMKLNGLGNPLRRIKPALRRRNAAKG